ncbi:hypothetical protein [Actinomadura logoneensis]|uniref:hypothetical protein n=1 Tax=Actinomadura logoneensis TaxID=2293572 RepID=UPI0018F1E56B|nr:hypothetical protein [Actinomadura logoneensis]
MTDSLLLALIGQEMTSVIFVRDYLQLDFDGPRLSLFVWPQVTTDAQARQIGDPGYRDSLCSLIGHPVRAIDENPGTGLALHFDSGSIVANPDPSQLEGPEIAMLNGIAGSTGWMVWRPGEFPFDGPRERHSHTRRVSSQDLPIAHAPRPDRTLMRKEPAPSDLSPDMAVRSSPATALQAGGELSEAQAERDALRRELGDLRAHLCLALGLLRREPGPEGLEVLSVASDKEILAAVRRLIVDALPPEADNESRWTLIDDEILAGRKIAAIQRIREEFGGSLHDALDTLVQRYDQLRRLRPDQFAQDADTYWEGFYS